MSDVNSEKEWFIGEGNSEEEYWLLNKDGSHIGENDFSDLLRRYSKINGQEGEETITGNLGGICFDISNNGEGKLAIFYNPLSRDERRFFEGEFGYILKNVEDIE